MMLRLEALRAELGPASQSLHLHLRARHCGDPLPGSPASGHIGWQAFDPETGFFIWEGNWYPLGEPLQPGNARDLELAIPLPRERGVYHFYVSWGDDHSGWAYQRGEPFLLVEVEIEGGQARKFTLREVTLSRLTWERRLRNLREVLHRPLQLWWQHWGLIRSMVRRDIVARYRGSVGDVLWTILNPMLLMATYFFVFGIVLRARFPGDPSRSGFALYFLAGMLAWLPVSEALGRAPSIVLEHRNFVKKLVFPVEILPLNITLAGLLTQAFGTGIFLAILVLSRGKLPLATLWLPALIVPQFLLTAGLAWFLAALGVFVRDLGQFLGYLLTLWFFLTPICYPEASLPQNLLPWLSQNPMYVLVRGFREVLLEGHAPAWKPLWKLWALALATYFGGFAWFYKLRRQFADVL